MSIDPSRSIGTAGSSLPHPIVLVAALMLALAGVWCVISGHVDDESNVGASLLREQVARAKGNYLRISRQATATRTRLIAAQDQLQRYTTEQYDELQRAAETPAPLATVDATTPEPQELTDATADRIEAERLKVRLTDLGLERSRLLEKLTAEHPQVHDVDSQIADIQRLVETLDLAPETIPPPPAVLVQTDNKSQDSLRRAWTGLVNGAIAGAQVLDQECRKLQQELLTVEAQRAAAEKNYLASSDALAAGAHTIRVDSSRSKDWAMILFGCAVGLPLLAIACRIATTPSASDDPVIREPSEIERLFHLPVAGWIGIAGVGSGIGQTRARAPLHWPLLMAQIFAAVIVFLVVAMTIQDPQWLAQVPSHPIDAFCSAAANLGGG